MFNKSKKWAAAVTAALGVTLVPTGPLQGADEKKGGDGGLRFVVDLSERKLSVYEGDKVVRTEPVAVGKKDHRTPTGSWTISQIDWNPDWTPPDSEWSEDKEPKDPGEKGNPMGRARLLFKPPYTIHGTDKTDSLGKAVSHGSIRVSNDAVVELGKMVMEHGGAEKGDKFVEEALNNPKEMKTVKIPDPIPITVKE